MGQIPTMAYSDMKPRRFAPNLAMTVIVLLLDALAGRTPANNRLICSII